MSDLISRTTRELFRDLTTAEPLAKSAPPSGTNCSPQPGQPPRGQQLSAHADPGVPGGSETGPTSMMSVAYCASLSVSYRELTSNTAASFSTPCAGMGTPSIRRPATSPGRGWRPPATPVLAIGEEQRPALAPFYHACSRRTGAGLPDG